MDNGLIFPYPPVRANAEPRDTNRVNSSSDPSGEEDVGEPGT